MAETTPKIGSFNDLIMLKLARDLAMDMRPLDEILVSHGVSQGEWEQIYALSVFQNYLRQAVSEWNSATNTAERVKLKSLAFVEEALPEFFARAHDPKETLNSKVEVLKTVARFAGVGNSSVDGSLSGERLVVTINLGADHQLKIEKGYDTIGSGEGEPYIEGDML
jgi:hypothetical protein